MKIDHSAQSQFNTKNAKPAKAEDFFLPSVIEVVRHMARIAAEDDYRYFLATGEIPYPPPVKGGDHD